MNHALPRRRGAPGFTLLEVLVVLGIIGVLAALLLPAVQGARDQARRAVCTTRLHQLALATHQYLEVHGMLPAYRWATYSNGASVSGFSIHVALLPHLEQQTLFDLINFVREDDIDYPKVVNRTARRAVVGGFLCPAEVALDCRNNYRGNMGLGKYWKRHGAFRYGFPTFARGFADGFSHTALFSERVGGSFQDDHPQPRRDVLRRGDLFVNNDDIDRLIESCSTPWVGENWYVESGLYWFYDGTSHTAYDHNGLPNDPMPSCSLFGTESRSGGYGINGPRSWHGGGVNVVLADGSARFITDQVDSGVWRALGTRAGNEVGM